MILDEGKPNSKAMRQLLATTSSSWNKAKNSGFTSFATSITFLLVDQIIIWAKKDQLHIYKTIANFVTQSCETLGIENVTDSL